MTSIRLTDGLIAAQALLLDLAVNPDLPAGRVALVLKLAKYPTVIATMAAKVFDQISEFPVITNEIKSLAGETVLLEYGSALYNINRIRIREGRTPLPVRFTDEVGRPHNVLYIDDYRHLRRTAA